MKKKIIQFWIEDGKMYVLYDNGQMAYCEVGKWRFTKIKTPTQ